MKKQTAKVAVIGAGISGLTAAYELTQAGHDVVVFERENHVGGRAGTRRQGHYPFDLGAQFFNNGYRQAQLYCNKFGLSDSWKTLKPSTHHLFCDDELHMMSFQKARDFLKMKFYTKTSRMRLLLLYLKLYRDSKEMDLYDLCTLDDQWNAQTAYDYCIKIGGAEVVDKAIDSLVATYHFHGAEELSASCLLAASAGVGSDFSYDYLVGGLDHLARAFAERVDVRPYSEVETVTSLGEQVAVTIHGQTVHYDCVVMATTPSVARGILTVPSSQQEELLTQVRYASSINVGFWAPQEAAKDLAMVAVPRSQNEEVCCYFNQHSKYPECLRDGKTLFNVFYRDATAKKMMDESDETILNAMKSSFLEVCPPLRPYADAVTPYDFQRWPEAIPKYTPQYVRAVNRFWKEGQGEGNVFLCGDYLNAPWTEGSIRCGQKVAKAVETSLTASLATV